MTAPAAPGVSDAAGGDRRPGGGATWRNDTGKKSMESGNKVAILKAPFPYFGGKSAVAPVVWDRLGPVKNYVEPFFGSGAMLLGRPPAAFPSEGIAIETVNDLDGMVANFWRALQADPEAVAEAADLPVNENDLHARHHWCRAQRPGLQAALEGDMHWYDSKIAGIWAWGMSCWIGGGWCDDNTTGPWVVVDDGEGEDRLPVLVDSRRAGASAGNTGKGITRQLPHLGNAGRGVKRHPPTLGGEYSHLRGILKHQNNLFDYFQALAHRLSRVRVCSGDWSRICGPSVTSGRGLTGVFFDPPYGGDANRDNHLYACESTTVAADVRAYCAEHGANPLFRIALCGYAGEGHESLLEIGWTEYAWNAHGGFGNIRKEGREGTGNFARERIWFSPHCLTGKGQTSLF